jgi:hypothetical protein
MKKYMKKSRILTVLVTISQNLCLPDKYGIHPSTHLEGTREKSTSGSPQEIGITDYPNKLTSPLVGENYG